jgi:hypothetical protein
VRDYLIGREHDQVPRRGVLGVLVFCAVTFETALDLKRLFACLSHSHAQELDELEPQKRRCAAHSLTRVLPSTERNGSLQEEQEPQGSGEICSVCLGDMRSIFKAVRELDDLDGTALECGHSFHAGCIRKWYPLSLDTHVVRLFEPPPTIRYSDPDLQAEICRVGRRRHVLPSLSRKSET